MKSPARSIIHDTALSIMVASTILPRNRRHPENGEDLYEGAAIVSAAACKAGRLVAQWGRFISIQILGNWAQHTKVDTRGSL